MSWDKTDINDKFKLAKCWIREVNMSNADNQIKKEVMRQYARSRSGMAYDDASIDAMISQMPAWQSFQDVYEKKINPNTLNESLYDPIRSFRQFREFKRSIQSQTQSNSIQKLKAYLINGTPQDIKSVLNSINNDDILNIISNILQSIDDDQYPDYYDQLIGRLTNIYKTHLTKVKGILPVMHKDYKITWNPNDNLVQKQSLTNAIFKIFESNYTTNFEKVEKNALCALWKEHYVDGICASSIFWRNAPEPNMYSDRTLGFGKYNQNYSCDFFKWFGNKIPFWAIRLMQSDLDRWYTFDQLKHKLIDLFDNEKRKIEIQKEQERKEQKEQSDIKKREYIKVYEYIVNTQVPFDKEKIDNTIEMWKKLNYSDKTTLGQIILVLHQVLQRLNDIDSFEEYTFEKSEDFFIEKINFIDDKLTKDANIDEDKFDEYKNKIVEQLNKYIDAQIEEEERARQREDAGALAKRVQAQHEAEAAKQQRQQRQQREAAAQSHRQKEQTVQKTTDIHKLRQHIGANILGDPDIAGQMYAAEQQIVEQQEQRKVQKGQSQRASSSQTLQSVTMPSVMTSKLKQTSLSSQKLPLNIIDTCLSKKNKKLLYVNELFNKVPKEKYINNDGNQYKKFAKSQKNQLPQIKLLHYLQSLQTDPQFCNFNTPMMEAYIMFDDIKDSNLHLYIIVDKDTEITTNYQYTNKSGPTIYGMLFISVLNDYFKDNDYKEVIQMDTKWQQNSYLELNILCSKSHFGKLLMLIYYEKCLTMNKMNNETYGVLTPISNDQSKSKNTNMQQDLINFYEKSGFISEPTSGKMYMKFPSSTSANNWILNPKTDFSKLVESCKTSSETFAPYPQSFDTFSNLMASAMAPSTIVQTWNPFSAISFKQNAEAFGRRMRMRRRCPYHKQQNCPYACPYGGVAPAQ